MSVSPTSGWRAGFRRHAITSLLLVIIPLPLFALLQFGTGGLAGVARITAGWTALALLYWWPVGAILLGANGKWWRRVLAFAVSLPLFFAVLWLAYAGMGSRLAPVNARSWIIYLGNAPIWFLLVWGLAALARRNRRELRWLNAAAVGLLVLESTAAVGYAATRDHYRWPATTVTRWRIVNVKVVLPEAGRVLTGYDVLLDGDRITAVVPAANDTSTAPAQDAGGRWLVPGLIDAHLHWAPIEGGTMAFKPGRFLELLLTEYAPHRRALLEAGVTSLRDLGGGAAATAMLRREIAAHELLGSRLFTVGRLVTSPEGHPAATIWTGELRRLGAIEATDSAMMVNALDADVRALRPNAVKFIYGTIGRAKTRLDPELLRIGVAWALRHGLPVAVHVETVDEALAATRAGATTLEHVATLDTLPPQLLEAIAAHRPWLDATIGEWLAAMRLNGLDSLKRAQGLALRLARLARLREAGARFIVGTDAPLGAYGGGVHDELDWLKRAGFPDSQLVRMVTRSNAEALGAGAELGRIAAGYRADLVLVDANPLADVTALRRPRWVIRDGQVVVRR